MQQVRQASTLPVSLRTYRAMVMLIGIAACKHILRM